MLWFRNLYSPKPERRTFELLGKRVSVEMSGSCGTGVLVCAANMDGELRDLDFIAPGAVRRNFILDGASAIVLEPQGEGDVDIDVMSVEIRRFDEVNTKPKTLQATPGKVTFEESMRTMLARELAKRGVEEEWDDSDIDNYSFEEYPDDRFVHQSFLEGEEIDEWTGYPRPEEAVRTTDDTVGTANLKADEQVGGKEEKPGGDTKDVGRNDDANRSKDSADQVSDKTA